MNALLLIAAIMDSFVNVFYLQIVTIMPKLGIKYIYNFEEKHWLLRLLVLSYLVLSYIFYGPTTLLYITTVIVGLSFIASFIFQNKFIFRLLRSKDIEKIKNHLYNPEMEMVCVPLPENNAICYPLDDILFPRHLINDEVNGTKLLVSYCAACHSSIVYNPMVNGQNLTFEVVAVWRRNMIMRDIETRTFWQQATGEAIIGKLKGQKLEVMNSQQMVLKDWLAIYPGSMVAKEAVDAPKSLFPKKRLQKMLHVTDTMISPGFTDIGHDLPVREPVFGISIDGFSIAFPVSELKKKPVFKYTLGETRISIEYVPETNFIKGANLLTGKSLNFERHWWFAWKEFHPDTRIFNAISLTSNIESPALYPDDMGIFTLPPKQKR